MKVYATDASQSGDILNGATEDVATIALMALWLCTVGLNSSTGFPISAL